MSELWPCANPPPPLPQPRCLPTRSFKLQALERQKTSALDTPEARRERDERRLSRLFRKWETAEYLSQSLPSEDDLGASSAGLQSATEDDEEVWSWEGPLPTGLRRGAPWGRGGVWGLAGRPLACGGSERAGDVDAEGTAHMSAGAVRRRTPPALSRQAPVASGGRPAEERLRDRRASAAVVCVVFCVLGASVCNCWDPQPWGRC